MQQLTMCNRKIELEQEDAQIGDPLDHLIGVWSSENAAEFQDATQDFEKVDRDLWK